MSSIKLKHASGNSVSIAAPQSNPASDRTLYVPSNANGTILTNVTPGCILQSKCTAANSAGQISSTSDSYVDVADIDLVLTPKSASSTFILAINFHTSTGAASKNSSIRLTFNHSGISQTAVDSNQDGYSISSGAGTWDGFGCTNYTHTPNTTNEITYRLQFRNVGASGTVYLNRKLCKIIAWEVAT